MTLKLIKTILTLASLTLFFTFTTGCGKTSTTEVGNAKDNGGDNNNGNGTDGKPTFDVAPSFSEAQIKVGQWIEWKKTSKTSSECVRWEISQISDLGIHIEGRFSRTCQTPGDAMVEYITFNPESGLVIEDIIWTEANPNKPGPLADKSIFNHIYGDKQKVNFIRGKLYTAADKKRYYPAFQLKSKSQIFLNNPKSPFHAFAMKWSEKVAGIDWNYAVHASNPVIESIPVSP